MFGPTRGTRADGDGSQVVQVKVRNGYHPSRIEARAGVPLRIVFDRQESDPCSERVVFSDPRVERRLSPNVRTEVILPMPRPGRIRFTCAMGRYRGTIIVRPDTHRVSGGVIRRALSTPLDAIGLAAGLWLCSLPAIALLAVLLLEPTAILPLALVALVGWFAGCLVAARRSHHPA